jgi:hypothetical protein
MSDASEVGSPALTGAAEKAFPAARDVSRWATLSSAEKRAVVVADEAAGFASGVAPHESVAARIARVRAAS